MLVLSRLIGEEIWIDGGIVITIVDVRGPKVRVGIDAPKHLRVDRREVAEAIQREAAQAIGHKAASVQAAIEARTNGNGAASPDPTK